MLWGRRVSTGMSHLLDRDSYMPMHTSSLRGHRDQITAIRFIRPDAESAPSTSTGIAPGYLLTGSKDTFLKLWDLTTQHCIQTLVAHRSELWTMDLNPEQDLVFTGGSEGEMKAWRIDHESLAKGLQETESGEVRRLCPCCIISTNWPRSR